MTSINDKHCLVNKPLHQINQIAVSPKLVILPLLLVLICSLFLLSNAVVQPSSSASTDVDKSVQERLASTKIQLMTIETSSNYSPKLSDAVANTKHVSNEQTPFDIDTYTVLHRASAMSFQAEPQVTPDYVIEMEFFPVGLLSANYAKLSNPDKTIKWFESQQSSKPNNRLSLWKDGNQLYTHKISALS